MSSSTKVELIGTFLTERFRFDNGTGSGTAIGQIRTKEGQIATIKGEWDADPSGAHYLDRMTTYRFYGSWRPYTNKRTGEKEDQFVFSTFVKTMPYGRAGVVNYLKQAPHVGDKIAEALLEYETIEGKHVLEILQNGEIQSPVVREIPPLPKTNDKQPKKPVDKPAADLGGGTAPAANPA